MPLTCPRLSFTQLITGFEEGAEEEREDKARGRMVVKNWVLPSGVMDRVAMVAGRGEEACDGLEERGKYKGECEMTGKALAMRMGSVYWS